ncbi:penicillin-binding protein 1B [Sedimenticola selenatireducens]|uniref:Penicillin-binding protein 1B n=1 Tax=Sedimenticola selenatireducens TaxID=191960 RepID=A0A2N6CT89_9GAMM|nr:penicillin-binding protein 1B [Sedimenticola selenatireducens]PLX60337.1 MAG: penicillin-binding protein 1B [Sedimenticola selenatireducens]
MAKTPAKRAKSSAKRKTSTRTRGRRSKSRTGRSSGRARRWISRLLAIGFLFSLVLGVYLLYLDHTVTTKFEGKRWAVPARVYGRPLELYPGAPVTPDQLVAELRRMGYQRVSYPKQAASWSRNAGRFLIKARDFHFWDSQEPGRFLDIRFAGERIESLSEAGGGELALVRLEAPEIGSIYPAHNEDRVLVQREDLPEPLVQALIVMEDRTFYQHHGVDPRAIARAVWANLRAGGVVQGGSTLTQQLVKNFYLTRERSLWRKLNEAAMALLLEAHYGKEEILGAYANEIYLGQDGGRAIHGFGLASHFYFNRSLRELDLAQMALLVAQVRGPSLYDPRRHPQRAKERRDLVLRVMQEQGVITAKQARAAQQRPLGVQQKGHGRGSYPAFMDLVRRQLHRDYREEDLTSEGLRIFTTLDPWAQQQAESAVAERLGALEKQYRLPGGKLESAAVLVDGESGEVRALVGGRSARYAGFNRALDAVRPIGSLVKPVVYLAALQRSDRYNLVTLLDDSPLSIAGREGERWVPENYDHSSHGQVPLHLALAKSYNLATVRLGMDIGLGSVADLLEQLGISRPITPVPAMLLGSVSLTPLEVAQLYQTFAAGGFYSPLRAIRGVQSNSGQALQRYPLTVRQSVDAGPVYLLNRNLQEVVRNGTGQGMAKYLDSSLSIAGKTGTTDELRDSWFAGFSGDKVAVVWVGRDDNKPAGLTGATGALQVWGDMMRRMHPLPLSLLRPDSVEPVWIDPASGFRADEGCADARQYPFIAGSAPTVTASCAGQPGTSIRRLFRSFFE